VLEQRGATGGGGATQAGVTTALAAAVAGLAAQVKTLEAQIAGQLTVTDDHDAVRLALARRCR